MDNVVALTGQVSQIAANAPVETTETTASESREKTATNTLTRNARAGIAKAVMSVCLSVCPSHSVIVSKRTKLAS